MNNIKILDCTFRDGGYVNNWEFNEDTTRHIIDLFVKAHIDYVEIGYIKKDSINKHQTLFNSFASINDFIPADLGETEICGMITFGVFPIEEVPNSKDSCIQNIRLIFKKYQINEAINYAKKLIEKGYKVFINPTAIHIYSREELVDLIKKVNTIHPFAYTIMDSFGVLNSETLIEKYNIINEVLDKDISLCFHSHNNMQLSFSNAQTLIKETKERNLIIDSSVKGMGRGAGNLCTELITNYINKELNGNYNLLPILKILDEEIIPIYNKQPWGYSIPFYLSAINNCHPNYGKFLINHKVENTELINKIYKEIPDENKPIFNKELIEKIYLRNTKK